MSALFEPLPVSLALSSQRWPLWQVSGSDEFLFDHDFLAMFGALVALAMAFVPAPTLLRPAVNGVSITANEPRRDDSRLLKPTGDPRLWWLDELLENAEERTVREKAKRANIEKWGAILREADTFDEDTVTRSDSLKINKRGEFILVALSAPVLLALFAHAYL